MIFVCRCNNSFAHTETFAVFRVKCNNNMLLLLSPSPATSKKLVNATIAATVTTSSVESSESSESVKPFQLKMSSSYRCSGLLLCFLILIDCLSYGLCELQCEKITIPACQNLGYNMTVIENYAGYTSQKDAEIMITSFKQIIDSGCSTQVRFLLCSSLFPLCSPNVPRPVPPCKSLCKSVKRDCFHDSVFGKLWPSFLNCDALPEPEKQGLCMQAPEEFTAIKQLPTRPVPAWNVSWNPRKSIHILNVLAASCPSNFTLNSLEECVPQCGYDSMYSAKQKEVAELLILLLSSVCFIFTLLSLVTFWAETTRFGFPEKPIIFLTLCYNLLSVCYLERIIFHDPRSERLLDDKNDKICLSTSPCLASYITTSYLTLSAGTWWLIFGFCWYLTTNKKWSCEALEKKSGLFHVLAWILPIIPPITALLSGGVKTHELTGFCIAPGFTEIPTLGLLILGAFFAIMSVFSLKNLKSSWQHDKLSQVMTRILIFSALYLLPTISSIIISFYEVIEIPIPKCMPGDSCRPPEKLSAIPTLLKLSFILIGGATTGLWVWSKKTYDSCRNRITTSSLTASIATTTTTGSTAPTKSFIIKSNHHTIISSAMGGDSNKYKRNYPLYPGIHFQRAPVTENSRV